MMNKAVLIIFIMALNLCAVSCAYGFEVSAEASTEELRIGDNVRITLKAEDASGVDVEFPREPENLGEFTFIKEQALEKKFFGKEEKGTSYVVGIYTTGTHVFPPVGVKYKEGAESEWETVWTRQIPFTVKSVLTGKEKDIRDIKGLRKVDRRKYVINLLLILALLAGLFIAYKIYKNRKKIIEGMFTRKLTPYEIAYNELVELKNKELPSKGQVKEYYSELSNIVRRYLEMRFDYRAPEMTTEEFLIHIKNAGELLRGHKEELQKFLSHCDIVKFAKYGPTPIEMLDIYKNAEEIVDSTKAIEKENIEEARS